ncbi:MAG: NosD domain-containing protein, partial [Methanosarcinaceae archaeon]|nr:NosD domain-containing protein [Methanosarcinaceae archaeon]
NTVMNGSYGIAIKYSENCCLTENTVMNGSYGIAIKYSENCSLTGNTAKNNLLSIIIEASENCSLTGNTAKNNLLSIIIEASENCSLTGNTVTNNILGIIIEASENCSLTGNTVMNDSYSIYIMSSENCSLTENTVMNNILGIIIEASDNSTLAGNKVSNNEYYGIKLQNSDGCTVNENTVSSNMMSGIHVANSDNLILSDNVILANSLSGVFLQDSNNTALFNNKFNNKNNTLFEGEIEGSVWNTTKTTGTNIVSGPYLGGNYWGTPNGTGWSQSSTDADEDGFCDTPYNITDNMTDYLPLKVIPEPESTGSDSHSPRYRPASSPSEGVTAVEGGQQRAVAGQETHVSLNGEASGVYGIGFTSESYSGMVITRIEVLDTRTAVNEASEKTPEGTALQYMHIMVGDSRFESSGNIRSGYIEFRVSKNRIEAEKLDVNTITLNRFHDEVWNPLPTENTGEDDEYFYFRTETPGYSLYSITGNEIGVKEDISENTDENSTLTPETRTDDKQETPKTTPGFGGLLTGIGLLLSVMSVKKNRPE